MKAYDYIALPVVLIVSLLGCVSLDSHSEARERSEPIEVAGGSTPDHKTRCFDDRWRPVDEKARRVSPVPNIISYELTTRVLDGDFGIDGRGWLSENTGDYCIEEGAKLFGRSLATIQLEITGPKRGNVRDIDVP